MFQVAEINNLEKLKSYRLAWQELWQRGRLRGFSTSYEWFETQARLNPERPLKVLVVSLAGKVIGLLPLVKKTVTTRLGSQRVLTYPTHHWGSWYGPIGPNSAATLTAGLRHLATTRRDWDLLDLPYVDRDRNDLGRTQTAARNMGWNVTERVWQRVPLVELPENWTEFLSAKRTSARQAAEQAEAQLVRNGRWELWEYRSGEDTGHLAQPLLEHWEQLLRTETQHQELDSVRAFAAAAEQTGQLQLASLLRKGKPQAVAFGFRVAGGGVEWIRAKTVSAESLHGLTARELEVAFLGRLLEQGLLQGEHLQEISPGCSLTTAARTVWATRILPSYRYSMAPWSHLRSALMVRYHQARTPRLPRQHFDLAPGASNSTATESTVESPTRTLKLYGEGSP